MTVPAEQFPYLQMDPVAGDASLSPYLPIDLLFGQNRVSILGLVDSGAAINVLPYGGWLWSRLRDHGSVASRNRGPEDRTTATRRRELSAGRSAELIR